MLTQGTPAPSASPPLHEQGTPGLPWALSTSPTRQEPSSPPHTYLLCKPDPAGLGDPLPGVDACVDPDGRTVASPGAELDEKNGEIQLGSCLGSLKGHVPRPRGHLLPSYRSFVGPSLR